MAVTYHLRLVNSIDVSGITQTPVGLTFDGKHFWLINDVGNLFQVNRAGVEIQDVGTTSNLEDHLLCFDGVYLWLSEAGMGTSTITQMDRKGNLIKVIDVSGTDTAGKGVETDGKYLWWCGDSNNYLYKMTKTGTIIRSIDISGIDTSPWGITFDGKYLWMAGAQKGMIYQLDIDGSTIRKVSETWINAIDSSIVDLTFDGKYIYAIGAQNDMIYQFMRQTYVA